MFLSLTLFCLMHVGEPTIASTCLQVAPVPADGKWARSPKQTRAVVLIHGYYYHLRDKSVAKAELRPWQKADGALVKELAKASDVYVFAYGQNGSIDTIVKHSQLGDNIASLRKLGYTEIVLVGHSAGGLVARHFVEDQPDAGVTKVVQVCTPNGGSPLAVFQGPKSQQVFLVSLTEEGRKQSLKERAAKHIPKHVQFVCVVVRSDDDSTTDGVVPCVNQWTADLREQGVPAVGLTCGHRETVRDAKIAVTLAQVIREPQPRWSADRIANVKKELLGN